MKNMKTILLTTMMIAPVLGSEQDNARATAASLPEMASQEEPVVLSEEEALNAELLESLKAEILFYQQEKALLEAIFVTVNKINALCRLEESYDTARRGSDDSAPGDSLNDRLCQPNNVAAQTREKASRDEETRRNEEQTLQSLRECAYYLQQMKAEKAHQAAKKEQRRVAEVQRRVAAQSTVVTAAQRLAEEEYVYNSYAHDAQDTYYSS